jgi:hypothetical protein
VGTGRRGPITRRFQELYAARVELECHGSGLPLTRRAAKSNPQLAG